MKMCLAFAFLTILSSVHANESAWNCTKEGKTLDVKGATAKEKQKACEAVKGMWSEVKAASVKVTPVAVPAPVSPRQNAGGGGSW